MSYVSPLEFATAAGEPHSVIRVTNLQATVKVGADAWGRNQGRAQPVLISVAISLRNPFTTASAQDSVDGSTVHYGILSKGILEAAKTFTWEYPLRPDERGIIRAAGTLNLFWEHILLYLTGIEKDGWQKQGHKDTRVALINAILMTSLEIEVRLPKASLIGSGVSVYGAVQLHKDAYLANQTRGLRVQDMRVPTIIGVNPNERLAKQIVIANVDINPWHLDEDLYCMLEEIVFKTIEESSFETLEALAHLTARRVMNHFIKPARHCYRMAEDKHRIRISLAKPTAVTFADAPTVEYTLDERYQSEIDGQETVQNFAIQPPYPLQGQLDAWIKQNFTGEIDGKPQGREVL